MAQKLALALIALFGLSNAQIFAGAGGAIRIYDAPIRAHGSLSHDYDHDGGPVLGRDVILGSAPVVLGERREHKEDDEPEFKVVNFVKPVRHDDDGEKKSYREDRHKEAPPVVIVSVAKPKEQRYVKQDHSEDEHEDEHKERHRKPKVQVPVFGKLKYVDDDEHGEDTKAPITIVNAPLVSTVQNQRHKVPYNNVVGKTNCPQCKEQNKEAKITQKSANKALTKNVDLLTTQVKGPIKDVVVKVEESDEESEENDHDDHDHEAHGKRRRRGEHQKDTHDIHGAAIINQKKLKRDLALGDARENAPFVVGQVVFPSNKLLSEDDHDDHDGHEYHKKSGRKHD